MDKAYSDQLTEFSIQIQTNDVVTRENIYLMSYPVSEYAITLNGVNKVSPQWSYLLKRSKNKNQTQYRNLH